MGHAQDGVRAVPARGSFAGKRWGNSGVGQLTEHGNPLIPNSYWQDNFVLHMQHDFVRMAACLASAKFPGLGNSAPLRRQRSESFLSNADDSSGPFTPIFRPLPRISGRFHETEIVGAQNSPQRRFGGKVFQPDAQ